MRSCLKVANAAIVFYLCMLTGLSARAQADTTYTIVVIGSSTAEGYGITPYDSAWVGRFTHYMSAISNGRIIVKNLAKGGYGSYQLCPTGFEPKTRPWPDEARNITKALSFRPDAIIVNLPSNDAASGYTVAEQQANFRMITLAAADRNTPIWVTTTQPRTNNYNLPREPLMVMKNWLMATYGDKCINFWDPFANPDGTIIPMYEQGDGIHLNKMSHRMLLDKVVAKSLQDTIRKGPVKVLSASVEQQPAAELLRWSTASERYIDSFRIERSADSLNWSEIGRTRATGTTVQQHAYTFLDPARQTQPVYYRVKAKDSLNRIFLVSAGKFVRAVSVYALNQFTGKLLQDGKVQLDWSTTTEKLTVKFTVERSQDSVAWTAIGDIQARGTAASYSFTDHTILPVFGFYRLRMEDIDGQFTYTPGVRVISLITALPNDPAGRTTVYAYPNPSTSGLWLKGLSPGAHQVQVFDMNGRLMHEEKQYRHTEIKVAPWVQGSYFIVVDQGKCRITFQKL